MGRIIKRLYPEKDALMQWNTQAGNVTNNLKVEIDFTLPTLSATNVTTCKCHVDDSSKGRYDMILGRYLLIIFIIILNSYLIRSIMGDV